MDEGNRSGKENFIYLINRGLVILLALGFKKKLGYRDNVSYLIIDARRFLICRL